MTDIRREKKLSSQLDLGMFVCELDRPWLGTPFLLEGLLLEEQAQIDIIASLCEFVYVDRTVSVGEYFIAPTKESTAIKRDDAVIRLNATSNSQTKKPNSNSSKAETATNQFSFFEVLKEIKASNQAAKSAIKSAAAQNSNPSNIRHTANITSAQNSMNQIPTLNTSNVDAVLTTQLKSDFSNFISGLTGWGRKQKKLQSSIDKAALQADLAKKTEADDSYRITIFDEAPPVEEEIAKIYPVFEQSQIATKAIFEALARDQKIDLTHVNESLNSMVESIERNPDALIWLAKLKQTDDYAYNHALNVSVMLMALGNFMALPKKQVRELGLAGLLQDIGKAKVPIELLHKQDAITAEEFELLKKHVDHALALLEVTENISGTVILTVSQHHERIDGTGYPYKLSNKQISLTGQMAGLIDTYCALTSNKVYAKGVYNQIALEEIHALRDIKFSSALIDQLVQFLGIYPVSSLVELNSGEVGVVIQQNSVRRLQPRVMIMLNPDKTKCDYPPTINLLNSPLTPTGEPYKIIRGLPPDSYGLDASNYFG